MKLLGQLSVFPVLPARIARLSELGYNLRWTWHPTAPALFRDLDGDLWEATGHNPVRLLHNVDQARLDAAAADPDYLARYDQVMADIDAYMHSPSTWFSRECASAQNECIAYFSAEFGLHESLPIYSGGLGVLAGDHCKAASDLGLPLVGIGFLYPQGYFRQLIDPHGWQQASYEKMKERVTEELKRTFRPEFLNRIDEIITFSPLSLEQMRQIVDLQMKEIQERLSEHGLTVELTPAARSWLAQVGYDPAFGARPLRRALQKHVESPLSVSLLSGEFSSGDTILVDVDEQNQKLTFRPISSSVPAEEIKQVQYEG